VKETPLMISRDAISVQNVEVRFEGTTP